MNSSSVITGTPSWAAFLFLVDCDVLSLLIRYDVLPVTEPVTLPPILSISALSADAILLIAAILDDKTFKKLYDLAYSLGLDVLCEVHDEEEMQRMINLDVKIIGINNRR